MIETKPKNCKGMGKAIEYDGCGRKTMHRKFGLCQPCLKHWLLTTIDGHKVLEKQSLKARKIGLKQVDKGWQERKKVMDLNANPKKYKKTLQDEINKLARMIDARFGYPCIDCGKNYAHNMDIHGGHFNSVNKNATLRYNLHNIHTQKSDCNKNGLGGGKERQYLDGLVQRYGEDYALFVDVGLQQKYTYIGLKNDELPEKIKIVRGLIRDFDTFIFSDGNSARTLLNDLIGIYL